jgi:hypothetical protein
MKRTYYNNLALPDDISFVATLQENNEVDQDQVNVFVDGLKKRPGWYKHDSSNRRDTRLFMMERYQPFHTIEIENVTTRAWYCNCCQGTVLYEGLHIGHIQKWEDELKAAGVLTNEEAKAAYNNLNNLRIECSTCNQGHDNE